MRDYYEILEISRDASDAQIKRAYRKLVVLYHPDKTSDPSAQQKIREINEAYNVLGDPERKKAYDLGYYKPFTDIVTDRGEPPHRDPAYRRRNSGQRPVSNKPTVQEMMEVYLPYAQRISLIAFIFCSFLFIDYILPFSKTTEKIIDRKNSRSSEVILTNENRKYKLSQEEASNFRVGDLIFVSRSRLLGIPVSIQANLGYRAYLYTTIYGNFAFMPLILLTTSSMAIFLKSKMEFKFNLGIVNLIGLVINIFFLFSHKILV